MPKYKGEENREQATTYPQGGKYYVVQPYDPELKRYDSLSHIASKAYGNGKKWPIIWKANKAIARKTKNEAGEYVKDPNNSFWPNDVIFIPHDPDAKKIIEDLREDALEFLPDADKNAIQLIIDGERVNVESATVHTTFDTAADGWAATVPWDPTNEIQQRIFQPYGYQNAEIYVGGELMVRGKLYTVTANSENNRRSLKLEGWSFTADIIDSTMRSPYERNKVTLEDRANQLIEGLGIKVVYNVDNSEPFQRVTADKQDTILGHLSELAKQRFVQISSTKQGDLLFHRASTGNPVATLAEGFPPFQNGTITFDGRARFNSYTVTANTPGAKKKNKTPSVGVANDEIIPNTRFVSLSANESDIGDLQKIAEWERSKKLAESFTLELPVNTWYNSQAENGKDLWRVNSIVTVISDTLFLRNGFDFLISAIDYVFEENGATAILTLVPPQVYTGERLEDPWAV